MIRNWQAEMERLVLARDQAGLDKLMIYLALFRLGDEAEPRFLEIIAAAPHDVQMWWLGACNCDGHLN